MDIGIRRHGTSWSPGAHEGGERSVIFRVRVGLGYHAGLSGGNAASGRL